MCFIHFGQSYPNNIWLMFLKLKRMLVVFLFVYLFILMGVSYSTAEVQLVYSTAPANWEMRISEGRALESIIVDKSLNTHC